jgi:hypothetical protein
MPPAAKFSPAAAMSAFPLSLATAFFSSAVATSVAFIKYSHDKDYNKIYLDTSRLLHIPPKFRYIYPV